MKKLLLLTSICIAATGTIQSQTAAAARAAGVGNNTSVRGVSINGAELGIIRYIQDVTGGIAAYGGNLSTINRGDSVIISGPLTEFRNLYELTPATFVFISANAKLPNPKLITPSQFGETYEGVLVRVANCSFATAGTFASNTNYTVTSNGQSLVVRTNSTIAGTAIPSTNVDIIGVGSQFCVTPSSGCTEGYQLLLRDASDIKAATVTGISENAVNDNFSVYPNPANGILSLSLSHSNTIANVTITDVLGKIVYTSGENNKTINVENLSKGFYTVSVVTENGSFTTRFIKE